MKKLLLFIMGAVCILSSCEGQHPSQNAAADIPLSKITPLKIGDTVPDIDFHHILNYKDSAARLSDFEGKLVILDFWATYCAPCIKYFPEFQQLQQRYPDRLQVLLITSQEKHQITHFFKKRKFTLPSVVQDTLLRQLFPHNSIPHEVWIKDGRVFAITQPNYVTSENIKKILSGKVKGLPQKKDKLNYDIRKPLLINNNGGKSSDLLYHSIFTKYLSGIGGGGGIQTDSVNNTFKIRVINANVLRLYQRAISLSQRMTKHKRKQFFTLRNRCLLEVEDKEKFLYIKPPEFNPEIRNRFFSYELILPLKEKKNAPGYMLSDLNRFFGAKYGIRGGVEKRKVLCWVLTTNDSGRKIATKGKTPAVIETDSNELWQNQPFGDVFYALTYMFGDQPYPFVDRSAIESNVDIMLPLHLKTVSKLKTYLSKYGLELNKDTCSLGMLVLKNVNASK